MTADKAAEGHPTGPSTSYTWRPDGTIDLPVRVLRIGQGTFTGAMSELSTSTADALRKAAPFPHASVISNIDGGAKNMADAWNYEHITFEAMDGFLSKGTAEQVAAKAGTMLTRPCAGDMAAAPSGRLGCGRGKARLNPLNERILLLDGEPGVIASRRRTSGATPVNTVGRRTAGTSPRRGPRGPRPRPGRSARRISGQDTRLDRTPAATGAAPLNRWTTHRRPVGPLTRAVIPETPRPPRTPLLAAAVVASVAGAPPDAP
ncbi:hypothetical protein [Streptomyces sp. TRM68416]|uniref:hypothetical protein n=1 Tax=Streptomyces sp. TRM68416 TaxID=2758412 RepID=UPI001661BCAB|nr:hypothetical protein [Streptomyces sp. TRM68416]MBD0843971.1 hypothetical protein [Streptomyces sp. TRM68416]